MEMLSPSDVATRWIDKWAAPGGPSGELSDDDLDFELPRNNPRLCLDAILEVLSRIPCDPGDLHFQVLAAGPLEDLLVDHGPDFVDEVEELARRNPSFRLLLNGVWTSGVEASVVEQLAKYRNAPW